MNRTIVLVLAALVLTFGTGLNGCDDLLLEVEIVVPPEATTVEQSLVVVVDKNGDKVVIPWDQFVAMDLTDYHTIAEVRAALHAP
ncbi:MAG: hypothetical protein OEP95_14475 [Myxococcales bacterium]|nr:hypothetical protein [Myxococcales bacterium]